MTRVDTVSHVDHDLTALRAAAERAGTALACLFTSADEFEAEVIRVRRLQGLLAAPIPAPARPRRRFGFRPAFIAVLAVTFLMI
jgi:hypothetical protein